MEKQEMETSGVVEGNLDKIATLFPQCITEVSDSDGTTHRVVDFDKLRKELGDDTVEGVRERYQFTWPQKSIASALANTKTRMTLRPVREGSVNFDTTENLYIEGDNLDVLKVLRETYLGKVKMIYIDPPYNTGKDFVYKDRRFLTQKQMDDYEGKFDEYGNVLVANTDANGRFHTDWLNFMYPRLKVARDLMSLDGVMFISIDDNELKNLLTLCNEIFGENHVECYIWDAREPGTMPKTAKLTVRKEHEYIIACYKATPKKLSKYSSQKYLDADWTNPDNDPRGPWMSANISRGSEGSTGGSKSFVITNPAGISFDRDWAVSEDEYKLLLDDNRIYFADNGFGVPRRKIFKTDWIESKQSSLFERLSSSQTASDLNKELMGCHVFDFPKPVNLIKRMIQIASEKDSIILDFFSGCGTTAHAVMETNALDGGQRKFIMVQLAEKTPEDSEANKAGYSTICEIGEERIRRAGKKVKEDMPENSKDLDTGFRVLRLDTSNMKDVFYAPAAVTQYTLDDMVSNVKEDRSDEDLLFQVMLQNNIPLSSKIEKIIVNGHEAFNVNDGDLIATFDRSIDDATLVELAKMEPLKFVMREPEGADGVNPDNLIDNFEQKFELYSPNTQRRIL